LTTPARLPHQPAYRQPDGPAGPANQPYFRRTDIFARCGGGWVVIGNYPALCYPRAKECKP